MMSVPKGAEIEDFFRRGSHYCIVMEKVEAIGIDEAKRIAEDDKLRVCKALVHGLSGLHKAGIVHARQGRRRPERCRSRCEGCGTGMGKAVGATRLRN